MLVDFIASVVIIPPLSLPSLAAGLGLSYICVYTTLLTPAPPSFSKSPLYLTSLRILLGSVALYFLFDFTSDHYGPKPRRQGYIAVVDLSFHYATRVLETCFISLWDGERPQWLIIPPTKLGPNGNLEDKENPKRPPLTPSRVLPLPVTFKDSVIYYFDLVCSFRGPSWYPDRVWSWAPKSILSTMTTTAAQTRSEFLRSNFLLLCNIYISIDFIETYIDSQHWDYTTPYPVTSLPMLQQIPAAWSVFFAMLTQFSLPYVLGALFFVGVCGSSPKSWPPMFVSPLGTPSLAKFWADRWQQSYSRSFIRMAQCVLYLIPHSITTRYPKAILVLRRIIVFAFSAAFHLCIFYSTPPLHDLPKRPFLDPSALRFFLSQPLGLVIESNVVIPLGNRMLPVEWRHVAPKVFAWVWLVGTGRWYSDAWVSRGMYERSERIVPISLVRGVWKGQWLV